MWLATAGAGHARDEAEFLSTREIATFVARIAALEKSESILDPVCGSGLLLGLSADSSGASVVHGVDRNRQASELARLVLPDTAKLIVGDALDGALPLGSEYDLIVGEPPFNLTLTVPYSPPDAEEVFSDFSEALLCWCGSKLSERGRVIFLLSPLCLSIRTERVWRYLASNGIYRRAAIHVPSGQLKATLLESYIVMLDRQQRDKMFVAQFAGDEAHQQQVLANLKDHHRGTRPAQGRLVERAGFRGFKALDAKERLEETAKRAGLTPVRMKDLVVDHTVAKGPAQPFLDSTNDLYLPLTGRCNAVVQPEDLGSKVKTARLVINGELADARFLMASMNHEIGRLFLETATLPTLSGVRQISVDFLLEGTFYLPSLQEQKRALELMSRLRALRAELDQIESAVWTHPADIENEIRQIRQVNHEDSFENWLEALPFPLASILWRLRASNGPTKEKNEILLHFFEALAEFWATLYLSAAKSDQEFWADHVNALAQSIEREKLSFDRATFGLWKCVIEFFSKKFRKLLMDSDRCTAMFRTSSREVLEMLFDRRLLTMLQAANSVRNDLAHGGVAGPRDIEMAHEQLDDLVQTCRSVVGTSWERYELVQPSECRFLGGVFNYKVRRLMGSRTPFASVGRQTIEAMEDNTLHLLDPDGDRSLKLLAFVRVMPSPKTEANACYFYNRKQADKQRFISYHFEAESEVEKFFADTQAALEGMRPFGKFTARIAAAH